MFPGVGSGKVEQVPETGVVKQAGDQLFFEVIEKAAIVFQNAESLDRVFCFQDFADQELDPAATVHRAVRGAFCEFQNPVSDILKAFGPLDDGGVFLYEILRLGFFLPCPRYMMMYLNISGFRERIFPIRSSGKLRKMSVRTWRILRLDPRSFSIY